MTTAPALLDPLRLPFHGSALIEASAGTGKTFTIAALYLRLVLGHGGDAAFTRALTPPEILVVTFTEAATKELRDRIRARLAKAAEAFQHEAAPDDELLQALRASFPPDRRLDCARQLQLAAEWMDEAAVSTIHGWCNRMLREHAFDSGSLFEQTLEADQRELLDEAVRDYWRSFFYPLAPAQAQCVAGWWSAPPALAGAVADLLPHVERMPEAPPPLEALAQARGARQEALAQLRAPWATWCDELQALLDGARDAGRINGVKLKKNSYDGWLRQLREWSSGACEELALSEAAWKRLTREGLREAWKNPAEAPDHAALAELATLQSRLGCLPDGRDQVLAHAAGWVAQRLQAEQHRRAEMGFDDLLTQLHRALHGPNGDRLAALIRAQFPVALIDEFQDTDPIQYGIFRRVYGPDTPAGESALVLIGDPKQAIYGFRGADIHTYLAAREDTTGRHTLGTNFRSSLPMVQAVNHFFAQAERRPQGQGAFLFRDGERNALPFFEVQAHGRDARWVVQGGEQPALTCWWRDEGVAVDPGGYRQAMAQACAAEIVRLLQLAQQGEAGFAPDDGALRPLRPQDIAILVNNRIEARAVREALEAVGVRSVYLSEQDTVFCTPAALELQRLLHACAEPEDGRRVRAALGTALLALDWAALDRLNHDEVHWEERLEQFRGYRNQWRRQGVLPMLRRLLHDFGVPGRLLASGDERLLTDVLHLAELLQQASAQLEGEQALLRWLAEQRRDELAAAENRQLRLESDADLLKVVTVHKSKGLEYPLVFVPYPCACRPVKPDTVPLQWHDADGRLQVSLRPDAEQVAQADRERLAEDLRKLYVALTRARFATWIALAPTREFARSAAGYLLSGGEGVAPGGLPQLIAQALGDCGAIAQTPAPVATGERYEPALAAAPLVAEPPLARAHRERWWIASYSRLRMAAEAGDAAQAQSAPESAAEETYLETLADAGALAEAAPAAGGTLHAFPRGAVAGTFLHGLLEWTGRKGFAAAAGAPQELQTVITRRTQPQRWLPHRQALSDWLASWLATPLELGALGAAPVAPRDLRATQVEMEFWLGASAVDAQALDRAVSAHTLDGVPRQRVAAQQLNGMLKGFIDLVFEHEGRWFVADYKSNWLGAGDAAYSAAAMRAEVLKHRYELQYSLYLFALHRLLRARLPDYDYDRHVGGAVYLFLRGHAAPGQGLHLEKPSRVLMDTLDALFSGEEVIQ
ncbi:MAG TPA: exodeoxyribonuclease V subunit beta [Ramlibacter sp.]|nr:exodeoxyribonuclease V subunit beta [Ramlibacter sp.]